MPNPYVIFGAAIGGILLAVVLTLGGYKAGVAITENDQKTKDLVAANKEIVRDRVLVQKVPTIVTKFVERKVEVTKEVERVVTVAPKLLAKDCVLPDGFGLLLVAAANGIDPETSAGVDAIRGAYGCNATLAAILTDLQAGWKNTAQLQALQQWAELVAQGP